MMQHRPVKKPPPNWGRSYPMQNKSGDGPKLELVRLDLDTPHDVTLYLNDGAHTLSYPNLNSVQVTFGTGGTSREFSVFPAVLGSVIHVAASQVIVRSGNYTADAPDNELGGLRVSAMAGIGRPAPTQRRLYNDLNSNNIVQPGTDTDFILDSWTTAIQLSLQLTGAAAAASVTVSEINRNPLGDTVLVVAQPVTNYANAKTIHPYCNVIRVHNANLVAVYADVNETILL